MTIARRPSSLQESCSCLHSCLCAPTCSCRQEVWGCASVVSDSCCAAAPSAAWPEQHVALETCLAEQLALGSCCAAHSAAWPSRTPWTPASPPEVHVASPQQQPRTPPSPSSELGAASLPATDWHSDAQTFPRHTSCTRCSWRSANPTTEGIPSPCCGPSSPSWLQGSSSRRARSNAANSPGSPAR